jgi:sodium transport system permease protein
MNLRKALVVYKKELLDLLRDRRTVITSFVMPVILYPLLMIGFSSMMSRQEIKLEKREMVIYVDDLVKDDISIKFETALRNFENLQVMYHENVYLKETYLQLLSENDIQAFVEISTVEKENDLNQYKVLIFYNKSDDKSNLTFEKINRAVQDVKEEIIALRLTEIDIDPQILEVVDISEENVAPPEKMVGSALAKILPYLLIILTISGASVISGDLVAGEKERGTLETILVSAAKRNELVFGKYLTTITISLITVLLNLFSMYISFGYILNQAGAEMQVLQLPVWNFLLILILMVPLLTLFSAILLSISTYSRNIKEAQSYQTPLIFGSIMLSMVSFLPGFDLNLGFSLIPIVNFSLMMRDILIGNFNLTYFLLIIVYTLVLDVFMIIISVRLFNNENILFRTTEEKSLKFWGKGKKDIFSAQFVFIFFIVLLLALFYLAARWQSQDLVNGLIKTQILIILLPVVLLIRISRTDIKQTLSLRSTKPVNFVLALLAVLPAIIIVGIVAQLINLIFPFSQSYLETMQNILAAPGRNILLSLFLIGVLPGICEEVLFRGYFLTSFKNFGFWPAIFISGLLFGIFHLDPFRLIPATLLGIWLGYLLMITKSIFVPMLAHFANNSLAIIISNFDVPFLRIFASGEELSYWYIIPAITVMYLIFNHLKTINNQE